MVVLKPLSRALADGDVIYCVIRGSAVNNDGFSNGLPAPNPKAQEAVLREAYARAGVKPEEVDYVEAHGTGTILGDPIEARALSAVLCADRPPERPLRIGSVKTNIGHLEAAAGIAGLIRVALSMQHRELQPSLHFERPNPHIPLDELRLAVQRAAEPWPERAHGEALAGVSSFGFGGTNCHVSRACATTGRSSCRCRRRAPGRSRRWSRRSMRLPPRPASGRRPRCAPRPRRGSARATTGSR
ncbi:hypothetical protein BE20_14465 [Sorangium cellulosum]|nr:hypothetical protein BE20_14465 [Sorangium cellulosum]